MSATTSIEWTDHTFNPWRGCAKVHTGCTHCYAEKNVGVAIHGIAWGEVWSGGQRVIAADSTWKQPLSWARSAAKAGVRRRVFCASLADVLEVPEYPPLQHLTTERRARVNEARKALDATRETLWNHIRLTSRFCGCGHSMLWEPDHRDHRPAQPHGGLDWLLLTKRPENWELVPEDVRPLVWLGTSVSDQETASKFGMPFMESRGFRLKFLSVEPLTGPIDLRALLHLVPCPQHPGERAAGWGHMPCDCREHQQPGRRIDWVIVGGESGSKARPCHVEWVRDVVSQCRDAGVPCFVKQLGEVPVLREPAAGEDPFIPDREWPQGTLFGNHRRVDGLNGRVPRLNDKKGGDMAEWPEYLRVREVPHG
ncbi:DUF5131 family protein [Myxococcus xanthus]|uniref:DUF5131 family protein n=1 Tax=Myxococcus xanthus TaxID=34 RepID=UPI0019173B72|nr:DUF5131 family protein [Myxococcus xanthus]QQR47708.1 DUF5131 family protein [Myxococcus xanthus]